MAQLQLRLRAVRSLFGLLLIASTWRLWFPSGGDEAFPLVPFFGLLTSVPISFDAILSATLIASLIGDLVDSVWQLRSGCVPDSVSLLRFAWLGILSSSLLLVALNQQRLQPWMYHLLLLTPILTLDSGKPRTGSQIRWKADWSSSSLLLLLTVSIYGWSAWSKFDVSFARDHGADFVDAIVGAVGLSTRFWKAGTQSTVAVMLPLGELLVAIALVFPRTRRIGLVSSIGMHGLLILAVGPWGMDQRLGVVLWNLYFIAQNIILILYLCRASKPVADDDESSTLSKPTQEAILPGDPPERSSRRLHLSVTLMTLIACLAPALRGFDCFDNWPAWAVYSASTRRVLVSLEPEAVRNLPAGLQHCLEPRAHGDGSVWLRIDQWALSEFDAPVYPQARLHVAVAASVAKRFDSGAGIRLVLTSPADRFTGKRTVKVYAGQAAIQELAAGYWLNTSERSR